ncbi:MAG: hypothetical protein MK193_03340 [Lentisphaeria bacterium]|nr:hypothetical protein [Lentisphaeria bacterium]
MNELTYERIKQGLGGLFKQVELPEAADQSGQAADIQCSGCKGLYSFKGMDLNLQSGELLCQSCIDEGQSSKLQKSLSLAKQPGVYIGAIIGIAFILWLGGAGRLNPEKLKAQDQGKPWSKQQYAKLVFAQAERALRTGLNEKKHGRDPAPWFDLAHRNLVALDEYWKDDEANLYLTLATGRVLMEAGNYEAAIPLLNQTANSIPQKSGCYLGAHFLLGKCIFLSGDEERGIEKLQFAMEKAEEFQLGSERGIDQMIDQSRAIKPFATEFFLKERICNVAGISTRDDISYRQISAFISNGGIIPDKDQMVIDENVLLNGSEDSLIEHHEGDSAEDVLVIEEVDE